MLFILSLSSPVFGTPSSPIKQLNAAQPGVRWDIRSIRTEDINCDGQPDRAVVGYGRKRSVWIGVVTDLNGSQRDSVTTLKFRRGNGSQDSVCKIPVRLETAPVNCSHRESGPLPGCRPIAGCFQLSLVDQTCDAVNFYWNMDEKRLVWWRH